MDIVFTIDGIRTLVNIIIIETTCVNLVLWAASSRGMVAMITT